jgi:hypothetical protein
VEVGWVDVVGGVDVGWVVVVGAVTAGWVDAGWVDAGWVGAGGMAAGLINAGVLGAATAPGAEVDPTAGAAASASVDVAEEAAGPPPPPHAANEPMAGRLRSDFWMNRRRDFLMAQLLAAGCVNRRIPCVQVHSTAGAHRPRARRACRHLPTTF